MRVSQEDPWAKIPHWVVTHPDLEATAIRIYAVLSKHANNDREAFPGIRRLADQAHCSTSTVRKAIDQLEEAGAIEVTRTLEGSRHLANHYHLPLVRSSPHPVATIATPPGATIATEQEPSLTRSSELEEAKPKTELAKPRPRNLIWDALVDVFGYQPENGERKAWGQFVAERTAAGDAPTEIPIRAHRLITQWGAKALTVPSLRKHWKRFGAPIGAATEIDVDRALDEIRRSQRRQRIEAEARGMTIEGGLAVVASPPLPRNTGQAATDPEET